MGSPLPTAQGSMHFKQNFYPGSGANVRDYAGMPPARHHHWFFSDQQ